MKVKEKFPLVDIVGAQGSHILKEFLFGESVTLKKKVLHSRVAMAIYVMIVRMTISYNKFVGIIPTDTFINGNIEEGISGIYHPPNHFYSARKALEEKKVITRDLSLYRLNLPGILKILLDSDFFKDAPASDCKTAKLRVIRKKLIDYWNEQGWEVEKVATLEEEVEEHNRRSKVSSERRKEKKASQQMRVTWIQPFMREKCKELEVFYYDTWTAKDRGCAANWLKYCEDEGTDPRKILAEVCMRWSGIQNCVKDKRGGIAPLHPAVNFPEFFKYRREIGAWLAVQGPLQPVKDGPIFIWDERLGDFVEEGKNKCLRLVK